MTAGERVATNAWVMLAALRTQTRAMRGSPFAIILGVVQPAVFLIVTTGGGQDLPAWAGTRYIIGVGLTAVWGATMWSAVGILRGDREQGTLIRFVSGPRSATAVFLGKCLGATIRTTILIVISTAATAALLGLPMRASSPGWMLVGGVVVLLSGTALGMLLSCLFLVTRYAGAWAAVVMYPIFIVSGMVIPLDMIPAGLRWISTLISMRWAADFLFAAAFGTASLSALAMLILLTGGYFVLAMVAFKWFLRKARQDGTLDHG